MATDVGEINGFSGPYRDRLIVPNDASLLAETLKTALVRPPQAVRSESRALADFVKTKFKISDMTDAVLAGYAEALVRRRMAHNPAKSFVVPSS